MPRDPGPDESDARAAMAVHVNTAHEHEDGARYGEHRENRSERERTSREQQWQPRQGDESELVAQRRDGLAQLQEPKVPVGERRHRPPGARDAIAWNYPVADDNSHLRVLRRIQRVHATERTSPRSSAKWTDPTVVNADREVQAELTKEIVPRSLI